MDKAEAAAALVRLQRAERAHHRNQDALHYAIETSEAEISTQTQRVADIDDAISWRQDTRSDAFLMTIQDRRRCPWFRS